MTRRNASIAGHSHNATKIPVASTAGFRANSDTSGNNDVTKSFGCTR
ncbi:MAG: hypothetical protein ACRDQ4_03475 [Pseudonocardiaceae bacterium]